MVKRKVEGPMPHNPGTPDEEVSYMRRLGREAWRQDDKSTLPLNGRPGRTEWWLGWYDERLRHIFGR